VELPNVEEVSLRERPAKPDAAPGAEEITVVEIKITCGPGDHGKLRKLYSEGDLEVDAPAVDGHVSETFESALYRACVRRHHHEDHGAIYEFRTSYRSKTFAN
jgi:hypothetical protein